MLPEQMLTLMPFWKDSATNAAIEELQQQVKDIVQELNLLKEQQALQTGMFTSEIVLEVSLLSFLGGKSLSQCGSCRLYVMF